MSLQHLLLTALERTKKEHNGLFSLHEKSRFMLLKSSVTTDLDATFYEPSLCLILQGAKEVVIGKRDIQFGSGECLVISHDVPVVSKITQASKENPYIALILGIDLGIIRSLCNELGNVEISMEHRRSLELGCAGDALIDALSRMLKTMEDRLESKILFEQVFREVHFRLLQEPFSSTLRDLTRHDSQTSNILKAISIIRGKYANKISMPDLAKEVGMSASSFHHHFKEITESTPLQYQKDLRLLEARKLITAEKESITSASLQVGYASPNQFSRDYTRKFNVNPSVERKAVQQRSAQG